MLEYRFSPIQNKKELFEAIRYTHIECSKMCKEAFGTYLPNSGNIAIFCHFDEEHELLTDIRKELTFPSNNPDQKYFTMINPFKIGQIDDIPEVTYSYLYIRKPKDDSPEVGDIDFYFSDDEFKNVKESIINGTIYPNARIYDREDLDMIELHKEGLDTVGYVSTKSMTEIARVKQSDATIL